MLYRSQHQPMMCIWGRERYASNGMGEGVRCSAIPYEVHFHALLMLHASVASVVSWCCSRSVPDVCYCGWRQISSKQNRIFSLHPFDDFPVQDFYLSCCIFISPLRSSISTRRHGKFSWSQWGKWKWRKLDFLFFLLSFFWFSYSSFRRQVTLRRRMKKSLAGKYEKEKFVNWVFKGD